MELLQEKKLRKNSSEVATTVRNGTRPKLGRRRYGFLGTAERAFPKVQDAAALQRGAAAAEDRRQGAGGPPVAAAERQHERRLPRPARPLARAALQLIHKLMGVQGRALRE